MATQSISSSPARQAVFTQEKLERIYLSIHRFLRPYKSSIELFQDILIWKKPVASALLYIITHWLFVIYVKTDATLVTTIGNLIFWLLLGDILWRAASKDGFRGSNGSDRDSSKRESERRAAVREVAPRFESVLIQRHTPRGPGELPSFNIICLWISEAVMWIDNIWMALRHWSVNEPLIFTFALALPGLVLSLIGKYIPTTVLLYMLVMGLIVWPYVEHYCLRDRTIAYLAKQYPGLLQRAKSLWNFMKAITVNRDKSDDPTLSLSQGVGDLRTQLSLQEAFDQATTKSPQVPTDELELPERPRPEANRRRDHVTVEPTPSAQQANTFHNPSMDSLLLDSLNPGPGDFPSLTDLDSSLALPQFPSGDNVLTTMPSITEEDEVMLPRQQASTDLDPFLDSVQMEFGSFDFPDGQSSRPRPQANAHPLSTTHRAPTVNPQPSAPPPMPSGFNSSGFSMYTTTARTGQSSFRTGQTSNDPGYTAEFVPPPTYQQVADGSPDAGVTVQSSPSDGVGWSTEGEGLIPRESSTPNVQDDSGMRKRPNSSIY